MTMLLCRPGHLHTAGRVLSCSEEQGLTVAPAEPASTNAGALRLRTSGVPLSATSTIVRMMTGGNPVGYATDVTGPGSGSACVWRQSTDTTSQYRGYIDSTHLVRVSFPATYAAGQGIPSTPRTLANGNLGWFFHADSGSTWTFYSMAPNRTVTTSTITSSQSATSGYRSDFVVLPSGRLVALLYTGSGTNRVISFLSDDNGATWAQMGISNPGVVGGARAVLCAEAVGDLVVAIQASTGGGETTATLVSRDGGATFTRVQNDGVALVDPRTCVLGDSVFVVSRIGTAMFVYPMTPGGGVQNSPADTGVTCGGVAVIATRDDGTVWAYSFDGNSDTLNMEAAVSLDGRTGWEQPVTGNLFSIDQAAYGTEGYDTLSAGTWQGRVVMLARVDSNGGSDDAIHLLEWGGWESVTDGKTSAAYAHTYVPIDYPQNLGWTRTNTGAGATLANQNHLRITATSPDNSEFRSSGTWWTSAAGDTRRLRFRVRIVSGGDSTLQLAHVFVAMDDGANYQSVDIRFSTTSMRVYDASGVQLGSTATLDLTGWTEFLVALGHDSPAAGAGQVNIWYRRDSDDFGLWTHWLDDIAVPEVAGLLDRVVFGGQSGTVTWDIAWLGNAETSDGLWTGQTNPDSLEPRSLTASADFFLYNGIHVGGFNGGAVPADTYTVENTYQYPKENLWRELRPSRQVRSATDNASWNVVFDASANDRFKGDFVALFGTNFRTATLQMNATDAWGGPSVSVSLDATVDSFTVGAGASGVGFIGPASSVNWRPGQFKSDGDAHRWFIEAGGAGGTDVYEIDDNDENRIYVEGVDFSAASGTAYIFTDRMGAQFTWSQYRFMRLLVGAQQTADNEYRCGTPIVDKRFVPTQPYDHGFVDRVEPNVILNEGDGGYRSSLRQGPRRETLSIQWPPLNRLAPVGDLELRLRDFYAAVEGGHRPFVGWRDTADPSTLKLYRVIGTYSATNVWGELDTAVTRIDTLVLDEEW